MICQQCLERPATIHLTKIINGVKQESHLCEVCAQGAQQTLGFEQPSNLFDLINAMLGSEITSSPARQQPEDTPCANCGTRPRQISQSGLVGCDQCYAQFTASMDTILRRFHGANRHVGKVPERRGGAIKLTKELSSLREQLQQMVANEEFEQAAVLRDRIKELENTQQEEGR